MMKEKKEKMKKEEMLFWLVWAAFTAMLTATLLYAGAIAFGIVFVILVLAINAYDLIQADNEQEQSKVDQLAEEVKALKEALKKKGGDE